MICLLFDYCTRAGCICNDTLIKIETDKVTADRDQIISDNKVALLLKRRELQDAGIPEKEIDAIMPLQYYS